MAEKKSAHEASRVEFYPITVRDDWGIERSGVITRVERYESEVRRRVEESAADFRIVLLSNPDDEPPADSSTVFCAPGPVHEASVLKEAAPAYVAGPSDAPSWLNADEVQRYKRGRIIAGEDCDVSAHEVFGGQTVDFLALAEAVVRRRAEETLVEAINQALAAPAAAIARRDTGVLSDLRRTLRRAAASAKNLPDDVLQAAMGAVDRTRGVVGARKGSTALSAAVKEYDDPPSVVDDVFLLRALCEIPEEATELLRMRTFLDEAIVPESHGELAWDRRIEIERLRFGGIVAEPAQYEVARAHFEQFQRRYRKAYGAHHAKYWRESAKLEERLDEGRTRAEGLHRLNSISELGPPLEMETLEIYGGLLENRPACETEAYELRQGARCAACGISLADSSPVEQVQGLLERIERGIAGQMARLASAGVRQALQHSGNARIEKFLQVIQAAHVSSLVEALDDELTGYLRRFLVEARVGLILEPLLTRVAHGSPLDREEARSALRDLAAVIERAFDAGQATLPGEEER